MCTSAPCWSRRGIAQSEEKDAQRASAGMGGEGTDARRPTELGAREGRCPCMSRGRGERGHARDASPS